MSASGYVGGDTYEEAAESARRWREEWKRRREWQRLYGGCVSWTTFRPALCVSSATAPEGRTADPVDEEGRPVTNRPR